MTIFTIALYTCFAALIWTFVEFSLKKTDSFLLSLIKNWIATLFLFSATVKLVDPVGFSIKLNEYFDVFHVSFLAPLALTLSFGLLTLEFVIGITLLFNVFKRFVYAVLLLMILFFTLLTGVSAIFGVVQDCGCFGDFLAISPWTSFIKDIILTSMTLLIVLNRKKFHAFFGSLGSWIVFGASTLAALAFTLHNYYHLPMWDFRAYKVGTYIPEKMEQIRPPVYRNEFTYKNKSTGEEKVFVNDLPSGNEWEFIDRKQTLIQEGIEAPIHDFTLVANNGEDLTEQILSFEKPIVLIVLHDVKKSGEKGIEKINQLIAYSNEYNTYNYAFVSSSPDSDLEEYKQKHQLKGTNISADETMLKTMIRSNPGAVLLEKGTITGKWHYGDIPSPEDLLPNE